MPRPANSEGELASWKEISDYLGVSVRAAQRWEAERGLPVRRIGGERGRVVASPAELDLWKKSAFRAPAWWSNVRFLRGWAVAATALLLAGAALTIPPQLARWSAGPPRGFHWQDRDFVVTGREQRELWRHPFSDVPHLPAYQSDLARNRVWFGDLDGDRHTETLLSYWAIAAETKSMELWCFSEKGKPRWRWVPERKVSDRRQEYSRVWGIASFRVFPAPAPGAGKQVAVSNVHQWSHPCHVAVLAGDGRLAGEYFHSGQLRVLETTDLDGDGIEELLLAGVNNGRRQAVLVVLDPRRVSGASVQPDGDPHQLQGLPPGTEKAIVYFPRTWLNQKLEQFNLAEALTIEGETITVKVRECTRAPPQGFMLYVLDRRLNVKRVEASVSLQTAYQERKARGELDRTFTDQELEQLRAGVQVVRK